MTEWCQARLRVLVDGEELAIEGMAYGIGSMALDNRRAECRGMLFRLKDAGTDTGDKRSAIGGLTVGRQTDLKAEHIADDLTPQRTARATTQDSDLVKLPAFGW